MGVCVCRPKDDFRATEERNTLWTWSSLLESSPLNYRIALPIAAFVLTAIVVTAILSAFLMARQRERETVNQLNQVVETLETSQFPFSENVLRMMRGLSGAEFAVLSIDGLTTASTFDESPSISLQSLTPREDERLLSLVEHPTIEIDDERYFAASLKRKNMRGEAITLVILYPVQSWRQARRDATLPALVVGAVSFALLILLAQIWRTMQQTERSRLLGQLAGGLAHQLRNAATGARMAVQLHGQDCQSENDETLDVALLQMRLMEEQLRALLSIGKDQQQDSPPCPVNEIVSNVSKLVSANCIHHHIDFEAVNNYTPDDPRTSQNALVANSEQVQAAVLNLTLNAIDAAGPGGLVTLESIIEGEKVTFRVSDSGPGPPEKLRKRLFDVFVTGKPDGVGFGLALVRQVAEQSRGRYGWGRVDDQTVFHLTLPLHHS